ncbi:unnamed protein product [Lactuca virosa]|uniref:Uncharacterized protein n=1 Tax=Lactuca virosa TaxID=75947 RepID=A0AAU9NG16_9ASTR|nr:unnamed protein product [Lactuca virosa]CAH1436823.1 unnamed protein product [Lactuca virosa]
MFEFGDELIIDSYRIPWLIWIQLLAMFLLVILLYIFTTTPSDLPLHFSTATSSASASQSSPALSRSFITPAAANTYQNYKVTENEIIRETGTSTSEVAQRAKKPNVGEGPTAVDEENNMILEHSYHPCHLFGLAKQAFLKCLGIDSGPDNSNSTRKRHKEKDE